MTDHKEIRLRAATAEDAPALLKIYAPYVEETAITFEYEVPEVEEFKERICRTLEKYPYIVAEREGVILGYAYISGFKERMAYSWSVETSIYVERSCRKMGLGRILYDALEALGKAQGIRNFNACIAYPMGKDPYLTDDSVRFHQRLGYRMVGRFHDCACKFGRWYDMVWMEKVVGEHPANPQPVTPFPELTAQQRRACGLAE